MTILLGSIALTRLQAVEVDEPRHLVELRGPRAKGSVFQDLGRASVRLTLAGIFIGEQSLRDIEALRQAHAKASPLSFSGDVAVGSEITDVVIERFDVQQIPGHTFRFEYRLHVSEWTEPAPSTANDLAGVDAGVVADADQHAKQSQQISANLDDPKALASALRAKPGLLARVDLGELAQAVLGALGGLDATDFAHLLGAISDIDPEQVLELVEKLDEAGGLEGLLAIVTEEGVSLVESLTGVDLPQASAVARAFLGGSDFVARVRDVIESAQALVSELQAFEPGQALTLPPSGSVRTSAVPEIVARTTALFDDVEALLQSARDLDLPAVIAELGAAGTAATVTETLSSTLGGIRNRLQSVAALGQLGALFGLLEPLLGSLQGVFANSGLQLAHAGLGAALPVTEQVAASFGYLRDAAALAASLSLVPTRLNELRSAAANVIEILDDLALEFRAADEAAASEQS